MTKQHALIIEDNRNVAFVYAEMARFADCTVEIIPNGADARQRLNEITPSVVILDLMLPGLSGVELLQQMQADNRLKDVPVIVATANSHLVEQARDLADHILIKPIAFNEMRQLVMRERLRRPGAGGPPRYI